MSERVWNWLKRPGVLISLAVGIAGTTVVVAGANAFYGYTNTIEFCISCHEMHDGPYQEYKKSLHYRNRVGARATCPDCHVPRAFPENWLSKVIAVKDVVHHVLGTIDTPEKFEAQRFDMAKRVWAKMEASGSRECANCHRFDAMELKEQGRRGQKKHPEGMDEGKTCIQCHKGVVHNLPKGYEPGS